MTFPKGYSVCKVKSFFFSETVELFETEYCVKIFNFESTEMKICTNGLDHINNKSHDNEGPHAHIW